MMKVMVTLLLGLMLAAPVAADSKHERVKELMALMQTGVQFEQTHVQMQSMFMDLVPTEDWSDTKRDIMNRYRERTLAVTQEELGWARMESMMIDLYATYFTEQEIIDMIEFHRSPTGQRMIEVMPMITEESMLFGQEAMLRLMPRMQALSEELTAELEQYRQASAAESEDAGR